MKLCSGGRIEIIELPAPAVRGFPCLSAHTSLLTARRPRCARVYCEQDHIASPQWDLCVLCFTQREGGPLLPVMKSRQSPVTVATGAELSLQLVRCILPPFSTYMGCLKVHPALKPKLSKHSANTGAPRCWCWFSCPNRDGRKSSSLVTLHPQWVTGP